MKIEVIREKFFEAVSQAERVSGKHVSLPVLSSIVIKASAGRVIISSTNLDVGVEINMSAKVLEEGVVALSGSLLKAFLSNTSQSKNVVCETRESVFKVISGTSEAVFNTVSSEDFPVIPKVTSGKAFSISGKDFVGGLKSVVWSASISTIKPELGSVYIYEDGDDLVFVATDSFRLAERRIKAKKVKEFDPILIPFKNVLEIIRIFESFGGDLDITISKNHLSIITPDTHLSSRVIDGNFPDYRQIIPKEFVGKATILKQDLSQVLKLGGLFSDTFNQVILTFNPKNKSMTFQTKNNEVGESKQEVKGSIEGEEMVLPFNHRYLSDCLQAIDSESVTLKIAGQNKPMIVTPAGSNSFTYLVMSMNR